MSLRVWITASDVPRRVEKISKKITTPVVEQIQLQAVRIKQKQHRKKQKHQSTDQIRQASAAKSDIQLFVATIHKTKILSP